MSKQAISEHGIWVLNRKALTALAAHLLLLPGLTLHLLPVPQLPDVLHLGLRDNIPPLEGQADRQGFQDHCVLVTISSQNQIL